MKYAADPENAFGPNSPAMVFDDALDDRQAEALAALEWIRGRRARATSLENMRQVEARDAHAFIAQRKMEFFVFGFDR